MVLYLRAANVVDGQLDLDDVKSMNFTLDEQARFCLRPGDVLVTEGSGSLRTVGASAVWRGEIPGIVCFQNTLLRLRPKSAAINPRFIEWWCRAAFAAGVFASVVTGANIYHVSAERLRSLPVALPEPREQRSIADFLDAETARIDSLIDKKRHLIELLNERAKSSIGQQVLGSTSQPFYASKSGFYEGVPLEWVETQLRHLGCEVQTGPFGSQLHADDYVEDGWPVVNPMNLVDGGIQAFPGMSITNKKRAELGRHILSMDDIVFGRRGEMGRAGLVSAKHMGWLCGTGSIRLRIQGRSILPAYLKLLIESPPAKAYFELASVGSTMDNLNSEILLSFPVLVPSLEEQAVIVAKVAALDKESESVVEKLERQIRLSVEHRQALIRAAVMGELPVPEYAG